jgi:hypothetical protein
VQVAQIIRDQARRKGIEYGDVTTMQSAPPPPNQPDDQ